jgi:excisionase family DNA binding protein
VSRLVDAQVAADHLGVPLSWVREQTRYGAMPHVPLGRYRRYDLDRLDEWWRELAIEPTSSPRRRPTAL